MQASGQGIEPIHLNLNHSTGAYMLHLGECFREKKLDMIDIANMSSRIGF